MRLMTLITVAVLATTAAALAQSGSGDGTDPQNKGSTGWTGAHPETGGATQTKAQGTPGSPVNETTGQKVQVHDEAAAESQPEVATGSDLKGTPIRFAPSQTPE